MNDGDTIFAIGTGAFTGGDANVTIIGSLGPEVMADAILRAVREATGLPNYPSVRDLTRLMSAVAQPEQAFGGQFMHEFPHGMAAAYCFHLVSNHPFVDGNKRTGFAASLAFLDLNGLRLAADRDAGYGMVLNVAQGRILKPEVIDFYSRHVATK